METHNTNYTYGQVMQDESNDAARRFLANVFLWMFIALGISAGCAYVFASDPYLLSLLINSDTGRKTTMGSIVMFAPLAFVLAMSFGLNRIAYPLLTLLFIAFATLMGISLSFIFVMYTSSSILGVFVTASLVFGVMAVAGYTTNQDLTKFGSIMIIGLIGIVIASVVNMFLQSNQLGYIISYISVAVFVGLTAYDVQKLKRIGAGLEYGDASGKKMAIMGALTLYLDFINLFLSLLRIFGNRK